MSRDTRHYQRPSFWALLMKQGEGDAKGSAEWTTSGIRAERGRAHKNCREPVCLAVAVPKVFQGSSTTIPVMRLQVKESIENVDI